MAQPAPVLRLHGTIHAVAERDVAPVEARPAQYDEQGNFLKPAVQPRDGYTVFDALVLTDEGGFLSLVIHEDGVANLGGVALESGGRFDGLPVRTFRKWDGPEGRRYQVTGYSAASDLCKSEQYTAPSSRRLSSASSAAS